MVGVRFKLLCWTFYFLVNEIDAVREVHALSQPVKSQRIRSTRRKDYFDDDVCNASDTSAVDKVNGFAPLRKYSYTVEFVHGHGKYFVKVTWKAPIGKNNSLPIGYWFTWQVDHKNGYWASSLICRVLSAENTSFVVHESEHWSKDKQIRFAVLPLPTNKPDEYTLSDLYNPVYETSASTSTTETLTESTNSGIPLSTRGNNKPLSTRGNGKLLSTRGNPSARSIVKSTEKQNREKEIFTIVTVAIAGAAVISLVAFILVLRHRKKKEKARPGNTTDPGYMYISYVSESESHIEKVADFCSWFRKHGYNVQMDIMATESNQEDLKELGRLRWGEKQLTRAKNVFLIVSPSYLNLCRFDEGKSDGSSLTQEKTIIYSEITQIRNELSSTAYISSRFIPVLFGVKETELPFWIKQLVVYNWPNDKMNDKLLYRISEEVSYENKDNI